MKHLTITLTLIILTVTATFSQERKSGAELSEIRKNKNHLDLDIKEVFTGFRNTTLLYKRTFRRGNLINVNSINLLRFSAKIRNQITFTTDPNRQPGSNVFSGYHPSDLIDFQLGVGFEKQVMNKHFVHYYGMDGIFGVYKTDDDFINATLGGVVNNYTPSTDRSVRTMWIGVNPFFGIKYYFTTSISIGIETGLSVAYFNQSVTEFIIEQRIVNGQIDLEFTEREPVQSHGIWTLFNNLRFLTVGYTF